MAPSTPPPPISPLLAALTTASTSCSVMSPRTSVIRMTALPAVELVRVGAYAPRLRHRRQRGHLRIGQLDIEDVEVLPDPLLVRRLRDDGAAELDVPAQDDLRRCLA